MKRLITFLQTKMISLPRPSLTVCPQSVVSIPPKSPPVLFTLRLAPTSFSPRPPIKPNVSTKSSQTYDAREHQNPYSNTAFKIPQIDGFAEESPIHHQNHQTQPSQNADQGSKCDNCRTVFETRSQLELHDEMNQFGCEECYICFTSKFRADLHELEKHPDTSYVVNHIPYTTKLQFAAGFR